MVPLQPGCVHALMARPSTLLLLREERPDVLLLRLAVGGAEAHLLQRAREVPRAALERLDARGEELLDLVAVGAIAEARPRVHDVRGPGPGEAPDELVDVLLVP